MNSMLPVLLCLGFPFIVVLIVVGANMEIDAKIAEKRRKEASDPYWRARRDYYLQSMEDMPDVDDEYNWNRF